MYCIGLCMEIYLGSQLVLINRRKTSKDKLQVKVLYGFKYLILSLEGSSFGNQVRNLIRGDGS